ncbi:MAG: pyrimidine dimer DNA glycosylase/endonuclease V [Bacteroidales bacterium]|nr:pyrimidine dimer DNA glycosylase/endonuclease V [Bacteroidales bacterium]
MRIWSLHPKYLDVKGLVALWREALLAKNVLEGKTTGYKNHPQLTRFKNSANGQNAINHYLAVVYEESSLRGYNFSRDKFKAIDDSPQIPVTTGQINYEIQHLLKKLKTRDPDRFIKLSEEKEIETHPLFMLTEGEIEEWEIV